MRSWSQFIYDYIGDGLMPLTKKMKKIKKSMEKTYGKKKGEKVFYASENKGKFGKR